MKPKLDTKPKVVETVSGGDFGQIGQNQCPERFMGTIGQDPNFLSVPKQWSKLKPSYEFHFKGLSNFSLSIEG